MSSLIGNFWPAATPKPADAPSDSEEESDDETSGEESEEEEHRYREEQERILRVQREEEDRKLRALTEEARRATEEAELCRIEEKKEQEEKARMVREEEQKKQQEKLREEDERKNAMKAIRQKEEEKEEEEEQQQLQQQRKQKEVSLKRNMKGKEKAKAEGKATEVKSLGKDFDVTQQKRFIRPTLARTEQRHGRAASWRPERRTHLQSSTSASMRKVLVEGEEHMERWMSPNNRDVNAVREAAIIANHLAQVALELDEETKENIPVTAILGDQSSAKTTICMALSQQAALYSGPTMATRFRTRIMASYDPSVKSPLCSLSYTTISLCELTPEELLQEMQALCPQDRKDIDTVHDASVSIKTSEPSQGVWLLDHPGFVLHDTKGHTVALANKSILEHFKAPGASPASVLLLCHSVTKNPEEAGWINLDLSVLPPGSCIMVVTMMDQVASTTNLPCLKKITSHSDRHGYKANSEGLVRMTPYSLLQHIEKAFKEVTDHHGRRVLPSDTRFYFVASSSLESDKLYKEGWEGFKQSQAKNQEVFLRALRKAKEWRRRGILLDPLPPDEELALRNCTTVDQLRADLLHRQSAGRLTAAKLVLTKLVTPMRDAARVKRNELQREFLATPNLALTIQDFLSEAVKLYHTLTRDQPFEGISTNKHPDLELVNKIKEAYQAMLPELGWSVKDEERILADFACKADFPPPEYRVKDFVAHCAEWMPKLVRPYHEKLYSLQTLQKRFQSKYAFLMTCIDHGSVDPQTILRQQTGSASIQAGDLKEPISAYIANTYNRLFNSKEERGGKGNLYIAQHVGLSVLLHAQFTVDILSTVSSFRPLLSSDEEARKEGRRFLDLLGSIKHFSATQNQIFDQPFAEPIDRHSKPTRPVRHPLVELLAQAAAQREKRIVTSPTKCLIYTFIAMFFDTPCLNLCKKLDFNTHSLSLTQPAFMAASLHFAPLFIHQDKDYLMQYNWKYPCNVYAQRFLQPLNTPSEPASAGLTKLICNAAMPFLTQHSKNLLGAEIPSEVFQSVLDWVSGLTQARLRRIASATQSSEHAYDQSDAELFTGLENETFERLAMMVHDLDGLKREEMAQLLSSLIRMASGPDFPVTLESGSDINKFEVRSLDYIYKRYMTAGTFQSFIATQREITAATYIYTHPAQITTHIEQITDRFVSLLLGYPYPYLVEERPKEMWYREPSQVITFLARYGDAIGDEESSKVELLEEDLLFAESPLLHAVVHCLNEKGKEGMRNLIHRLWENVRSPKDLNSELVKVLAPEFFRHFDLKKEARAAMDEAKQETCFWEHSEDLLRSYIRFLEDHGEALGQARDDGDLASELLKMAYNFS